jgi:hypothetical protein
MLVARRCAVLGALVAVLWLVSAANATAPVRFGAFDVPPEYGTIDCSQFNPAWTFHDDFVDFFHVAEDTLYLDAQGNPVREVLRVEHVSNDVNTVTAFTLHEHNHFTVTADYVSGTLTLNGAINIMQRRGVGSVIRNAGHKVIDGSTGDPIMLAGPDMNADADFCAALAP